MFSFGSNTGYSVPAMYRTQRTTQTPEEIVNAQRKARAEDEAHKALIKQAAIEMFSNTDKLKKILEKAISDYLMKIKEKWFHDGERQLAKALMTRLSNVKTTGSLIALVSEITSAWNEWDESFKKFIFNSINLNFCDNKLNSDYIDYSLKPLLGKLIEMKTLYDKSLLCYAGLHSQNSVFYCLPEDLITEITIKLHHI